MSLGKLFSGRSRFTQCSGMEWLHARAEEAKMTAKHRAEQPQARLKKKSTDVELPGIHDRICRLMSLHSVRFLDASSRGTGCLIRNARYSSALNQSIGDVVIFKTGRVREMEPIAYCHSNIPFSIFPSFVAMVC